MKAKQNETVAMLPVPITTVNPQTERRMDSTPCYEIPLELIDPNPNNPRKYFGDEELLQLASTIEYYGVIQPVLVHPVQNGETGETRFMLVHGERRTRASMIAGKSTIPAFIREMPEDQIEALALLENLHRVDISEFELADAFRKMVYDENKEIATVADQFGVSVTFVRNRILLLDLITELRDLFDDEAITISMALELCKYDEAIQMDVYENHLKANCAKGSWRPLKKAEFAKKMIETYSMVLDNYAFDKTACATCNYNAGRQMDLFGCADNCARCLNRECLLTKVNIHLFETILAEIEADPLLSVATRALAFNKEVAEWLRKSDVEIHKIDYSDRFFNAPMQPKEPQPNMYKTPEEYNAAQAQHQAAFQTFENDSAEIAEKLSAGKLKRYLLIRDKDFMYVYENTEKSGTHTENPVATLKKQDEHNLELSRGNIIKNTVKLFQEQKVPVTDITETEEKYLYLAMLDSIHTKFIPTLGLKRLSEKAGDEDKIAVINKLNARRKILIKRVFLMSALSVADPDSPRYALLEEFAQTFYPDRFIEIKQKYMEMYEKRHDTIQAKLAEISPENVSESLLDSASGNDRTETETPASDEQQPAPDEPTPSPESEENPAETTSENIPHEIPESDPMQELEDWQQILIEMEPENDDPFETSMPTPPQDTGFATGTSTKDQPAA